MSSYNPFKMWGSYVGLILLLLIFSHTSQFYLVEKGSSCNILNTPTIFDEGDNQAKFLASQQIYLNCLWDTQDSDHPWYSFYGTCDCHRIQPVKALYQPISALIYLATGFLIGWGIHSLFRRFSK